MGGIRSHPLNVSVVNVLFMLLFATYNTCSSRELDALCTENGRFYRKQEVAHDATACTKYFLCLDGEEFEFQCSQGLLFDVERQTCEPEERVNNCNVTLQENYYSSTKPSTESFVPPQEDLNYSVEESTSSLESIDDNCDSDNEIECNSGECISTNYICDGYPDCGDGEDEDSCDQHKYPNMAKQCNPSLCHLPDCYCSKSGSEIPSNLDPIDVPQMITLTFDDAITFDNIEIISQVFKPYRKNPNGCPLKATFFVSHYNNNYFLTQKVWNEGHEVSVHSVTHRSNKIWWSHNATVEDWFDEMVGQANIIHKYSNVRMSEIRGLRVPFLQLGWNRQFLMMKEFGFVYDSSIVAPKSSPPLWPYTLDFAIPHTCEGNDGNCPSSSFPGIWETVINPLQVDESLCYFLYSCPKITTSDELYTSLVYNFKKHYTSNKAPFQLSLQASWIKKRGYILALERFLDEVQRLPNVWFVTHWQLIEWMRDPQPIDKLHYFKPWLCDNDNKPYGKSCRHPNVCKIYSDFFNKQKYFYTCQKCPKVYPWFRNEFGID